MRYERYDKVFEEAGRDMKKFDQLLERSKKQRALGAAILQAIVFVCLLLLVCTLYEAWSLFYPFWHAVHSGQPIPTVPSWLKAVSAPGVRYISVIGGMMVFVWVLQLITAFNFANERVKTLILFRSLRDAPKTEARVGER